MTLKIYFIHLDNQSNLNQVPFWDGQEAQNEFKVTYEPLKHRNLDYTQVAFWAVKEEGNVFQVPGDYLIHSFLVLTKVEFWACQEAENYFIDLKKSNFLLLKKWRMTSK